MERAIRRILLPAMAVVALNVTPPIAGAAQSVSTSKLDHAETTHLIFMREEEKLARDVYLTFAKWYPHQPVFQQIGDGSEQKHTDTMRDKLAQYGIPDPNPQTNNLPTSIGVFTGADYGWYFTEKFTELTKKGAESELSTLYVGALIEELDMYDIVKCPKIIVEQDPAIELNGCGLDYTDEKALKRSYRNLVDGSGNHLRAFVGQIEAVIGEGNYKAQFLTQDEVDELLGR